MWPPPQPGSSQALDSQFQNLSMQPPQGAQNTATYLNAHSASTSASSGAAAYPTTYNYPQTTQASGSGYPAPASSGYYPTVPPPASAAQQTYPGMYAAAGNPSQALSSGYTAQGPPQQAGYPGSANSNQAGGASIGAGWTSEAVQTAHASVPGQFGHYGGLQHAPSFNTATVAAPGAGSQAAAPAGVPQGTFAQPQAVATSSWVLQGNLPKQPSNQLVGPLVRFNDYDPVTGAYAVSVLVVSHPSLASSTVQLHYAVNAPATQSATSQILDDFMGYKFYRFDIRLTLTDTPGVCNYLVGLVGGQAPMAAHSFNLPARNELWRWICWSCNGFHEHAAEAKYGGIAFLWNDVMQRHQQLRYHLQVGGGDQLYNDHVLELPTLKPWLSIPDKQARAREPFTPTMLQEVEQFYFGHYCQHFCDPAFAPALAGIPYCFSWDDHDIFDGWGSYPDYLQKSAVFQGMFAVARRFYLLFQQHCRYDNANTISNTMGEYSYHQVRSIGPNAVLLSPDTRSERTIHQVLPPKAWEMLFAEVTRRLSARPGAVQHLLVLLPVPIVYPKIPVSERALAGIAGMMGSSQAMKNAIMSITAGTDGTISQFSEPDLLDDLRDHWTSSDHAQERQMLVRKLQEIAAAYSVRVTFISGDVHVGAFGCFQAHPKQHIRVVDPKFMLQVVSSAIGNEPPPTGVQSLLETSSVATTLMGDTLDKMIKAFPNGGKLRGARNYCEVVPLLAQHSCHDTGATQPPGGLAFTLRVEHGPPGRPSGVETFTQVAPVLLAGPRAAEGQAYAAGIGPLKAKTSGVLGQVAAALPGQSGKQLQDGMKVLGHKLGNFLSGV